MKQMLLAAFSALCFNLPAQITVTSMTFPAVGDTLRYARTFNPPNINFLTPPGGNQFWDFSGLNSDETFEVAYSPANEGQSSGSFPGAETAVIGTTGESYYNITPAKFELLGYAGSDPANFGVQVLAKFAPPLIERRSPMNFFDINQQVADLSLPFSIEDLPDSLLGNIPGIQFVDSIRVRINYQRLEAVDGWGTLNIPGGQYPVLREKRTEYTTTALDVHSFLGWIPVPGGSGGLLDFLGTDTTVVYRFLSNTEKEEIAIVTANSELNGAESVRYKNNGTTPVFHINAPGSASIQAYPNPATEWVRFDCSNLPPDDYTLKIFSIIGKEIWKNNYTMSGNKSIRLDLNDFKKGTYFYSLEDRRGNIIGTKRLVVVKP